MDAESSAASSTRRHRAPGPRALFSLMRGLWRYRGELEEHQRAWLVEAATATRTLVDSSWLGRSALWLYRWAMRALLAACVALLVIAAAILVPLHEHWWALVLAAPFILGAIVCGWKWFVFGAALRMLDEYADPQRKLPMSELPARLRELAAETKGLAGVPPSLLRDLVTVEQCLASEPPDAENRQTRPN